MDGDETQLSGKGRGRGAAKGKAKARAKAGSAGSRPGKAPCLCCKEARHANSRFCKEHKRSYDSMAYQAKKAEQQGEGGAVQAFNNSMADDFSAKAAIEKFCEANPPDQRYARKSFIDWADFKKTYGQRTDIIDRSKCKPMWEGEFIMWAMNEKALPKAEAENWWKEHYNNPRIERDNEGYKGRLQLWIPTGPSKLVDKSRFTESNTSQGSKPMKNPTPADVEMLQEHVKRQRQSVVDPFFTQNVSVPASVTSVASVTPKQSEGQHSEAALSDVEAKRPKIDVDRAAPKLMKSMEKELTAMKKNFSVAHEKATAAMTALDNVDLNLLVDDQALFGLLRSLDLRLHFLHRWECDDCDSVEKTDEKHSFAVKMQKLFDATPDIKIVEPAGKLLQSAVADFEKMKTLTLAEILAGNQARLPIKDDRFFSRKGLENKKQEALSLQTAKEYEALKADWQVVSASAVSMFSSVAKISNDVTEHVNTKVREAKRQATRKQNQDKQDALKAIRDQARKAADEIKAKPKVSVKEPVFGIDFATANLPGIEERKEGDQKWGHPWVMRNWAPGKKCLDDSSIKKSLDTFGSQYRKLGDPSGRHQYSLQAGGVKEMMDTALQQAMPGAMLDLVQHGIEGGDKFMASCWFYGFSPGMTFCGLQPNAAAQLRLHAKGQVNMLVMSLSDFTSKIPEKTDPIPFNTVRDHLLKMDGEEIQRCREKGVEVHFHCLSPNELLYLPTGYLTVEVCDAGVGEVCGVRKSFFPLEKGTADEYSAVLSQFEADGRSVGQMQSVSKALSKDVETK